ncbi:MAG TPA: 16S rRNA (uracil(1498)-N(3))-methyltransferase [bacterium]|nr:16S rRNA (uracil(1498)-N(3))-methyltransferase [bacterium]
MGDDAHGTRVRRKLKHRFFVPVSRVKPGPGGQTEVIIPRDTAHHMRTVLRLSAGAVVILFDNSGQEYEAEITECKPSVVKARVVRSTSPRVESPLKITLAQALIKGNSFDKLITLATELGVTRLIPIFTARTVVSLNKEEAAERVERWERIVEEAAAQSKRVRVPVIEAPAPLKEFLERKRDGVKIILYERGGGGQLQEIIEEKKPETITLLAGPEGGFEQAEVKQAMDAGFKIWGLGPRILRAENAGAVATAILQFRYGDMG